MNDVKEKVVGILKKCNDPELPIDLWNLGLIYDLIKFSLLVTLS